jgi:hypothetical protein
MLTGHIGFLFAPRYCFYYVSGDHFCQPSDGICPSDANMWYFFALKKKLQERNYFCSFCVTNGFTHLAQEFHEVFP